ncbi:Abi family protein [Olsenella massiliensis]|uniref:Abi family protein n=1 Tax=Olsenella massiliensis TaxID=1622075 RepID=UPI00071D3175|nr:Abi family protein [Olsenella massiliensis]
MNKVFLSIDEQIALLRSRGVACDERAADILTREGYYAIINGYKGPFLNEGAQVEKDHFAPGTTLEDLYALCRFDRELRGLTFKQIMHVETLLRSVISLSFCECHRRPNAYLDRNSYTSERHYLRGAGEYQKDLDWLMNTLSRYAHAQAGQDNVRVTWYQTHYDAIPLWVIFSDLTFGNLRYFYALMRKAEQQAVCERIMQSSGRGAKERLHLTPRGVYADLMCLVDVRNACAHEERLYSTRFGQDATTSFTDVLRVVRRYLTKDETRQFGMELVRMMDEFSQGQASLLRILSTSGIREAAQELTG